MAWNSTEYLEELRNELEEAALELEETEECGDLEDRVEAANKVADLQAAIERELASER